MSRYDDLRRMREAKFAKNACAATASADAKRQEARVFSARSEADAALNTQMSDEKREAFLNA